MSTAERFCQEIEAYLRKSGMTATVFGRLAMSDPNFVFELRGGRVPSVETLDRVTAWISEHPPSKESAA